MMYIGDKTQFINTGLDEADMQLYICPFCGAEKEVAEKYDLFQKMFFPLWWKDTICECDEQMERKIK